MEKTLLFFLLLMQFLGLNPFGSEVFSQQEGSLRQPGNHHLYCLKKHSGMELVGFIVSEDEMQVEFKTIDAVSLSIPRSEIAFIRLVRPGELRNGQYLGDDHFYMRHFFSPSALSMKKGDNYLYYGLLGGETHIALSDHFSLGAFSSWIGLPVMVSGKFSFPLNDGFGFSLGGVVGSATYLDPSSIFAIPHATVTIGDKNGQISFSGGYFMYADSDESFSLLLYSLGGIYRISKKLSFVFDSMFYTERGNSLVFAVPGLRFYKSRNKAFQIGLGSFLQNWTFISTYPLPVIGWYRRL